MPVTITAACNRAEHPCGCIWWLELDPGSGTWARGSQPCSGHGADGKFAATREAATLCA